MANYAYKYRLYPTTKQAETIRKTVGCARFVYNVALSRRETAYHAAGVSMSYEDMAAMLTRDKKTLPWLKEADSSALQQSLKDLCGAFDKFFDKSLKNGYPRYKSKRKSRHSYRTVSTVRVLKDGVQLPKLGVVKAVISRPLPEGAKIVNATVCEDRDGIFMVSVCFEVDETVPEKELSRKGAVGLDYKSDGLFVTNEGEISGSPKHFRKSERKLRKEQRRLSRKQKGSKNREKQRAKVAKVHAHIANQRNDHLQKLSTAIAKRHDVVCVETLDMKAMANKGFGNGKATLDNGWGMFLRMLEYKLNREGGSLVKVDKWYASSQICNACGAKNPKVKDLRIRRWACPACGDEHDRDVNAAKNILDEGLRILGLP